MDITEAITKRKSIRAFKPDPVPQSVLREILELAQRAPSWTNIQPWELAVVTGTKLQEIRQQFLARLGQKPTADLPRPLQFPEPYATRSRVAIGLSHEAQGMTRGDKLDHQLWERAQSTNFGSPCEIYVYTDRSLYTLEGVNVWPIYDCGSLVENIMLLATKYGLGTIAQAQAVVFPDIIRKTLSISDSKLLILGLAIGYPDWNNPLNQMQTPREPLDRITRWHGFTDKVSTFSEPGSV